MLNDDEKRTWIRIGLIVAAIAILLVIAVAVGGNNEGESSSVTKTDDSTTETVKEKFTGTKEVVELESIPYATETVQDPSMEEGSTYIRQTGINGEKKVYYNVEYKNDVEVNRTYSREEIVRNPVNEIKVIGTHHTYTGYCSVEGYYRRRYASCVGDYSPQAKANAEAKAAECNASSYAVQGCYNTYR